MTITAECHVCRKQVEVPSLWAQAYVMKNAMPCRDCYWDSIHNTPEEDVCICKDDENNLNCTWCY
jgi:hypothetical protein